jgi:hypothetical protein
MDDIAHISTAGALPLPHPSAGMTPVTKTVFLTPEQWEDLDWEAAQLRVMGGLPRLGELEPAWRMRKKERQKAARAANKQKKHEVLCMMAQVAEVGPLLHYGDAKGGKSPSGLVFNMGNPWVLSIRPVPIPIHTHTREGRYGFVWVWVWVQFNTCTPWVRVWVSFTQSHSNSFIFKRQ